MEQDPGTELVAAAEDVERALADLAASYQRLSAASAAVIRAAYNPGGRGVFRQAELKPWVGIDRLATVIVGRMCALGLGALVDRRLGKSRQDPKWVARLEERVGSL